MKQVRTYVPIAMMLGLSLTVSAQTQQVSLKSVPVGEEQVYAVEIEKTL